MNDGFIIDTPEGIQAYRYLGTLYGLRMEVSMRENHGLPPYACPTRGMALRSARRILAAHDIINGKAMPTRKHCLKLMEELCKEKGLVP